MRILRVRDGGSVGGHEGDVFSCVYSGDGVFVLSAGWDGYLRLWVSAQARLVSSLQAAFKPLSCCAFSPEGTAWLSGSMDGVLTEWHAITHQRRLSFVAHIRPISALQFSPDGRYLATASWDRKLMLRRVGNEREGQALIGHHDIVAGCRWLPDSKWLLSWSHDGTLRLWDAESAKEAACLKGHADRVTAACLSRDGQWVISGGRDGSLKLWDLRRDTAVRSAQLTEEVRGCWCLHDGASVLTVQADGWMVLWSLPDFEVQAELSGGIRPLCGALSPSRAEVVLGSDKGTLHFVAIEGSKDSPVLVTPTLLYKPSTGAITRFLGKRKVERNYQYTCPACGHVREIASLPRDAVPCVSCNRLLRVSAEAPQLIHQ